MREQEVTALIALGYAAALILIQVAINIMF